MDADTKYWIAGLRAKAECMERGEELLAITTKLREGSDNHAGTTLTDNESRLAALAMFVAYGLLKREIAADTLYVDEPEDADESDAPPLAETTKG